MTGHTRRNVLRGTAAIALAGGTTALRGGPPAPMAPAAPAAPGRSPFLEGVFAPVTEELTAFSLPVTGRIPHELNGRYLRNGPNAFGIEDPRAHHWMTGPGMVHGVRLRNGRAEWYRNRWVRSAAVAGKLGEKYPGPGARPTTSPANTHVIPYKGRILAMQESGPLPYELDGELNTLRPYDFRVHAERVLHRAHQVRSAHADELHAIAYYPTWDHVRHIVDGPHREGDQDHSGSPSPAGSMVHDFGLTRAARRRHRHPGHLRSGGGPQRRARAVRRGTTTMRRGSGSCRATGGRHPLVRGGPRLLLAHAQRVRPGDDRGHGVSPPTRRRSSSPGAAPVGPAATGTPDARPLDDRPRARAASHQRLIDDRPQEFPRDERIDRVQSPSVRLLRRPPPSSSPRTRRSTGSRPTRRSATAPDQAGPAARHLTGASAAEGARPRAKPVFVPRDAHGHKAAEDDGYVARLRPRSGARAPPTW